MTLGISRVVDVVNKMNTMNWSKERHGEIVKRTTKFLTEDMASDRGREPMQHGHCMRDRERSEHIMQIHPQTQGLKS